METSRESRAQPLRLNVGETMPRTEVEGPGVRYALWVQGCPFRCPGCCNPQLLEFEDAKWRAIDALADEIIATSGIEGATFLGGEPFAQARGLAALAERIRAAGLSVMIFTGYLKRTLEGPRAPDGADVLLAQTDLLVDGPYVEAKASQARRWIGSDNQSVHILSERYAHLAGDGWPAGNHGMEIRMRDGEVAINGHPRQELIDIVKSLRWAGPGTPVTRSDGGEP